MKLEKHAKNKKLDFSCSWVINDILVDLTIRYSEPLKLNVYAETDLPSVDFFVEKSMMIHFLKHGYVNYKKTLKRINEGKLQYDLSLFYGYQFLVSLELSNEKYKVLSLANVEDEEELKKLQDGKYIRTLINYLNIKLKELTTKH